MPLCFHRPYSNKYEWKLHDDTDWNFFIFDCCGFLLLLFSTSLEQIEYKTKSANQFNQKRKQLKTIGIALAWKIDTVKVRTCNDANDFKLSVNRYLFASLFRE